VRVRTSRWRWAQPPATSNLGVLRSPVIASRAIPASSDNVAAAVGCNSASRMMRASWMSLRGATAAPTSPGLVNRADDDKRDAADDRNCDERAGGQVPNFSFRLLVHRQSSRLAPQPAKTPTVIVGESSELAGCSAPVGCLMAPRGCTMPCSMHVPIKAPRGICSASHTMIRVNII